MGPDCAPLPEPPPGGWWRAFTGSDVPMERALARCGVHRRGTPVQLCSPLAVPATGSTTLTAMLQSVGAKRHLVHHQHSARIDDIDQFADSVGHAR